MAKILMSGQGHAIAERIKVWPKQELVFDVLQNLFIRREVVFVYLISTCNPMESVKNATKSLIIPDVNKMFKAKTDQGNYFCTNYEALLFL